MTEAEELERYRYLQLKAKMAQFAAPPQVPADPDAGKMSVGRAMVKGVQDLPTFGFGDELGGGEQAVLAVLAKHAPGIMAKLGIDTRHIDQIGDPGKVYQETRDANRLESKRAANDHPVAYYGTGIAATLPLAAVAAPFEAGAGAGLGARMLAAGGNGALQGALAGLGNSEATDASGLLKDTGKGLVLGGATSAAFPLAGRVLRRNAGRIASALEERGIESGRKVLTNGADQLSKRAPVSAAAVREAYDSGALRAFGNNASTLKRLQGLTAEQGERYAKILADLEAAGVEGPHAQELAARLARQGEAEAANSLASPVPGIYRNAADELASKAVNEEGRLGLTQAENIKRSLQKSTNYSVLESKAANEARRDIASQMRQSIEDTIENQMQEGWNPTSGKLSRETLKAGADFVPVKQRLGRLLEATGAAERGAARGAQRTGTSNLPTAVMEAAAGMPGGPAQQALIKGFMSGRGRSAAAAGLLGLSDALSGVSPQSFDMGRGARTLTDSARRGLLRYLTGDDQAEGGSP